MGKPTILELLDTVKAGAPDATDAELAERVEAVLAIVEPQGTMDNGWAQGWKACRDATIRALDGERC